MKTEKRQELFANLSEAIRNARKSNDMLTTFKLRTAVADVMREFTFDVDEKEQPNFPGALNGAYEKLGHYMLFSSPRSETPDAAAPELFRKALLNAADFLLPALDLVVCEDVKPDMYTVREISE